MRDFMIMPENGRWYTVKAASANMAFASERCWFGIGKRIAILDIDNENCFVYTVD